MQLISLGYYSSFEEASFDKEFLAKNNIQSFLDTEKIFETDFSENTNPTTIKLLVDYKDYQNANLVLSKNRFDEDLEKLDIPHTLKNSKNKIICPKCGSNNIYKDEEIIDFYLNTLAKFLFLERKARYVCYYCSNHFKK